MRVVTLCLLVLQGLAVLALAKLSPLTVRDVSLMLRSGYSVDAIEKDLAARRFLGPIDSASEKELTKSGATAALLADLKGDRYAVPEHELSAVQQDMEMKSRRRATAEEESRRRSASYQEQLTRNRTATPTAPTSSGAVAAMVKGDLVTSRNGILNTYNDQVLEKKKLIGLYFSARWCPSCRKFTPQLVEYYNRVVAAHPEFEIVFISSDRSAPAMEEYMRDTQMPWPAVKFEKLAEKEALRRYAGDGIPCLVIVDEQGRVVSDSYNGKTYRGPDKVLADLDQLFAGGAAAAVAQNR